MKTCVVREFLPPAAKTTRPLLLLFFTGSSFKIALYQATAILGYGETPNCATKPGTTRKKLALL